jgi:hypothetical protein
VENSGSQPKGAAMTSYLAGVGWSGVVLVSLNSQFRNNKNIQTPDCAKVHGSAFLFTES